MIRYLVAFPLIMHGLANLGGVIAFLSNTLAGFTDQPWIFSKTIKMHSLVGRLFGLLWLLSVMGLVVSGLGILLRQNWWETLTILSCAISMIAITSWWRTVPPGARFGAIFDLAVIIVLLSPLGGVISDAVR